MTISISCSPQGNSEDEFAEQERPNYTVNLSVTSSTDDEGETITSTTCTAVSYSYYNAGDGIEGSSVDITNQLTLTSGVNTCTITGTFIDPFSDTFTYVERGSSNKIQTPSTVVGVSNMPTGKEYYELEQDTRNYVIISFSISVVTDSSSANLTATMQVNNEWEGIRSFVDTYYD